MRGLGADKSMALSNLAFIFSCPPSAGVPARSAVARFFLGYLSVFVDSNN